jgi:hypothetical protein
MLGAVALTACATAPETTTKTLAPAPTTVAPVTTSTTATTTTPPTTEDPDVAAVRAAHLAYLAMFEVVGDPPDPDHPELARRATGDAYDRLRAALEQDRILGNRMVGRWDSDIRAITIDGDRATVEDCLLDLGAVLGPHGKRTDSRGLRAGAPLRRG